MLILPYVNIATVCSLTVELVLIECIICNDKECT